MRYLLGLGLLFCLLNPSFSQYHYGLGLSEEGKSKIQGFKIGITPSALMNKWLGYQGKISYTHNNLEIELNAGFLSGTNNDEPYNGYRFRPVLKYYYKEREEGIYYWALGGLLRQINIDARGTFSRFDNTFFQEMDFELDQRMLAIYGMFGFLIPLDGDNFFIDIGAGVGRAVAKTKHLGIPQDAELVYDPPLFSLDDRDAGTRNLPTVFFHFSIMYRL